MSKHIYEKAELVGRLDACLNKTFGEIDTIGLFDRVQEFRLQKGVAGAVVEQCIFGYPPDPAQEADLIILDGPKAVRTELKTTGMVIEPRPVPHFVAKEPMSITAVGIYDIAGQDFWTSHFWDKLEHMLIVYYHYASGSAVSAGEYGRFRLKGYEFHEFSQEEVQTLKADWDCVREFCAGIVSHHPGPRTAAWKNAVKQEYIGSHGRLRRVLSFIDLAPRFPPRFRLKKPTVSAMIAKHFGYRLEQLPGRYATVTDIDRKCRELAERYAGQTVAQLARLFGIPYTAGRESKSIAERVVAAMFGGTTSRLDRIEDFGKFGLIAKTVTVTSTGKRTEDMKLFRADLSEMARTALFDEDGQMRAVQFEDSDLYAYFADHALLCIMFEEPAERTPYLPAGAPDRLGRNRFLGFKRVVFSDAFIDASVRRLWEDTREKILGRTLADVAARDKNGRPIVNRSGDVRSAPNFMKGSANDVFIRGSAQDSSTRHKTECVNGIRMLPQYVWIKGTAIVRELEAAPGL